MTTLIINDELISTVVKVAFPDYAGRKIGVKYGVKEVCVDSYWDSGRRSYFCAVNLATLETKHAPTLNPMRDKLYTKTAIPQGFVIVEHAYYGMNQAVYIHTPIEAPMLPEGKAFNRAWYDVLNVTRSYKSSYANIKDYRAHELKRMGYNAAQVEAIRVELIAASLMTKNKAISNEGKNYLEIHKHLA